MTLDEFLRWEDGTDTRYELIRGVPVPCEVPPAAHSMLLTRVCAIFHHGLKGRRDCFALASSAIASPTEADTCYLADLIVKPLPIQRDRQLTDDPILIVEILSEGTAIFDREIKATAYREIRSVQEILLIDSRCSRLELHQRQGFDWQTQIVSGRAGAMSLISVGIEISMAELYEGRVFAEDEPL
jgi:Uma2 family endonuclease